VEKESEGKYGKISSNVLMKHSRVKILCFSFECYYLLIKLLEVCVVFFSTE